MNWIEKVKAARAEGSFEKTMAILNHELSLRPEDPQIYYQIAWTNDALGKEQDAVPAYEKAIELGLPEEDLKSAYLGLGSTYRSLGEYKKSKEVFERGIKIFPDYLALKTFLSLTYFNLAEFDKGYEILLRQLAETSSNESIQSYKKALIFYSDKLDQTFE